MSDACLEDRREFDFLTQLPNTLGFRILAREVMADPEARADGLTTLYFNLEHFRHYNEKYGFAAGNELLAKVAAALKATFAGNIVARLSGDHFVTLLRGVSIDRIRELVEHVQAEVRALSPEVKIALKCGAYVMGDEDCEGQDDAEQVAYDRAKLACDKIAHHHDTCLKVFDEDIRRAAEVRSHVINTFSDALREGRLVVYYQPQVFADSGKLCGVEALVRWDDDVYGLMAPGMFIGVLEECHLIDQLDLFVLNQVCRTWRELTDQGRITVPVSVNLSRLDFTLCDVFDEVERCVQDSGVPRSMVNLEVTESALSDDPERLSAEVTRFRDAGYQVWLDDFGSDYSSFTSLKDYEFDLIKADIGFLRSFDHNPRVKVIISSIVDMAHKLGMSTLIEGVETEEQYSFLKDVGCQPMQGYLVGRPMPLEELLRLIDEGKLELPPEEAPQE